jgi:hypothetical protein
VEDVAEQRVDTSAGLERGLHGSLGDDDVAFLDQASQVNVRKTRRSVVLDRVVECVNSLLLPLRSDAVPRSARSTAARLPMIARVRGLSGCGSLSRRDGEPADPHHAAAPRRDPRADVPALGLPLTRPD